MYLYLDKSHYEQQDLKSLAETTLLGHVAQMMEGHPLVSEMKPSLLREAANEIARQTRGLSTY